jgi:hypothetical protein
VNTPTRKTCYYCHAELGAHEYRTETIVPGKQRVYSCRSFYVCRRTLFLQRNALLCAGDELARLAAKGPALERWRNVKAAHIGLEVDDVNPPSAFVE